MTVRVYNTQSRSIEPLETIEPGVVRMYVCGVTPYAKAHIGHAMSSIVFDMIKRYLIYRGYVVRHVTNFTDIDDKIIARANREGISPDALTGQLIDEWHREMIALNICPPMLIRGLLRRWTEIVEMIERPDRGRTRIPGRRRRLFPGAFVQMNTANSPTARWTT